MRRSRRSLLNKNNMRHVVFLIISPIVELDLFGPLNVFALAGGDGPKPPDLDKRKYKTTIVTTGEDLNIIGECGVNMLAHKRYRDLDEPIDTLLVVGGGGAYTFDGNAEVCAWLQVRANHIRRIGAICTGAFVLAAAGLLDGRRAATHWGCTDELGVRYPKVKVDPEPVWIKDGKLYTSAGITAGIDLALGLVEEDMGSKAALAIARLLVVFLKRPGGQRQFSIALSAQAPKTQTFADLVSWIAEHLADSLSVEELADRMAMSPRNFTRVFTEELGVTPARYVRQVRIEAARIMLEQTRKGMDEIAELCGFGSDELMRRAFISDIGVPPSQYRATFESGPLEKR
ncbi:Transcriptional regulator GlxA family, contains an amidase domain and an AraC-type DNA-binding HTH domain [Duganella sp. CF402]|nr:AraC family transcriptional regulator with amidase-like domain [Duganella sp. BK701]SEM03956.1 Transcriptional regulator GlxA family, contains an amidase domain and an AraC-type DNA-binding HTH domain [Duganella sp. CF402]